MLRPLPPWLAIAVALVVCAVGCESSPSPERDPPEPPAAAKAAAIQPDVERFHVPLRGDEPQRGPSDAMVTIVELGDFECPYCKKVAPTLDRLVTRYGDAIRIVWKDNPLPFHRNARLAATAAREARAQRGDDAFWAMHDRLFAQQHALGSKEIVAMAEELGLDASAVAAALEGDAHAASIDGDQALAKALHATGTPAFFVNGRAVRGAQPLTRFALIIEDELRRARALVEAGTPPSAVYATLIEGGIREVEPTPTPKPTIPSPAPSPVYDIPVPPRARSKGPKGARVVIQEFSDFQCPVCRRVGPTLAKVLEEYGDDVRLVFRDYPLDFHPDAHLAAEAAREVFAQRGNAGFWKYHDLLLENQHALARKDLEAYARRIGGIDMKRFRRALDTRAHRAAVDADMAAVAKAGARIGTPAFFINGRLSIQGAYPFETFKAAIDAELD